MKNKRRKKNKRRTRSLEGQTFQKNDVVFSLGGFNLSLREVFWLGVKTLRNGNVFSFPKVCNLSTLTPFLTVDGLRMSRSCNDIN